MVVIIKQLEKFIKSEIFTGVLLAFCAIVAIFLANSSLALHYYSLLAYKFAGLNLQQWINDALMAIFFFVIGMEIKKEIIEGELSKIKQASLPIAAAIGGMIFPAFVYYFFNPEFPFNKGWGIPMATDIAFALGVLSLFGKKIPKELKIFLLALAIVDDLGAILVIAIFYTSKLNMTALGFAIFFVGVIILIKNLRVNSFAAYTFLGLLVWLAVLLSGVHATIAGVVLGLLTPVNFPTSKHSFATYSPVDYLITKIHPWVSYAIMPIFALANAGIKFQGANLSELIHHPITLGVMIGLIIGKPLGVILFSYLIIKIGLAKIPKGLNWSHIIAIGFLAGVGFTMALFISNLALSPEQEIYSKTGIVIGSIFSAILGSLFLKRSVKSKYKLY